MTPKIILASLAAAIAVAAFGAPSAPPTATATRIELAPVIDGIIDGDPAWALVQPTSHFWQNSPDEGEPASEATDVYIAFTADTLFVGVVLHDRSPEKIITSGTRRDFSTGNTDCFQFILDTFADEQNGFVFGTNPAGLEYDGQYSLAGGNFNRDWDGSWEVRTSVTDSGWTAEFTIPFRTIRYPSGNPQTWGINFQRNIRRRNERSYWAPLGRQFDLYRLVDAGKLDAIEVPAHRNLTLTPYVLGERRKSVEIDGDSNNEIGLDAKYSLTSSLTLDLTLNTDFAQVEADEEQINLDRFNLFFPEKRSFFLENADPSSSGFQRSSSCFTHARSGSARTARSFRSSAGRESREKQAGSTSARS